MVELGLLHYLRLSRGGKWFEALGLETSNQKVSRAHVVNKDSLVRFIELSLLTINIESFYREISFKNINFLYKMLTCFLPPWAW